MVKILRIASYVLTAAAAVALLVLVVFGTRGNAEMQAFLEREGVVERLKAQSQETPEQKDTVSPLVNQARAFALRIDPPPPPPPRREAPPRTETVRQPSRPEPERAPSPPTPPRVTARYELLATAHYPDRPDQSLALLKPTTGSTKWHRQGERIGHLEIHEIRQGSVVLYQDGVRNTELFVPAPEQRHKPLLKADAAAATTAGRPSHVDTHDSAAPATATAVPSSPRRPTETATGEPEGPTFETGMSRAMQTRRQPSRTTPSPAATQRAAATRTTAAPTRTPTPEEQKESLEQSISSIQEIMGATAGQTTPEEQKKEQEMWMQLLEILQHDKQSLEADAKTDASPPADAKAAEND